MDKLRINTFGRMAPHDIAVQRITGFFGDLPAA